MNEHGERQPLVSEGVMATVEAAQASLQEAMDYDQDYDYSYFGLKTLLKGYLQPQGRPIERPQHMLLRVSLGIWGDDVSRVAATYKQLSSKRYTHATPSLFNLGTVKPNSASCYLLGTDDSVDAFGDTIKKTMQISKSAGGIGISLSNVRGTGALIRGTGGRSNGLVPLAKMFNVAGLLINQGGKRNGANSTVPGALARGRDGLRAAPEAAGGRGLAGQGRLPGSLAQRRVHGAGAAR